MQILLTALLAGIFFTVIACSIYVNLVGLFACGVVGFLSFLTNVIVKGSRLIDLLSFIGIIGSLGASAIIFLRFYF